MPTYTFIKDKTECGNIEGCKFVGDVFRTRDEEVAERLRNSATFNKTVKEIYETAEAPKEKVIKAEPPQEEAPKIENPEVEEEIKAFLESKEEFDLNELTFAQVAKIAKNMGIKLAGTKSDIIDKIEKARNERQ